MNPDTFFLSTGAPNNGQEN